MLTVVHYLHQSVEIVASISLSAIVYSSVILPIQFLWIKLGENPQDMF
jgi:hypothetical protein